DCGQRSFVAGVHGLEHVERFRTAHFADDDPVRPHAESVADQVALGDLAHPFQVGRTGFQLYYVRLLELQLGSFLDGHQSLFFRDEPGERVKHRRLPGAGPAGDDDADAAGDHAGDQVQHFPGNRAESDKILGRQSHAESTNGQHRAGQRQRWNDGVDAAAVGPSGVHHRRHFVDAPADAGRHALDYHHQVIVIGENDVALLQKAVALQVDFARPVDQDVADRRVVHRAFERAQAERFVHDLIDHALALDFVHRLGRAERELYSQVAHVAA